MKVLANISKQEHHLQGILKHSFDSYGLSGKATTRSYDIGNLIQTARASHCDAIFITNPITLKNIVNDPRPSLDDWRGSVLKTSIPIVISNSLDHINTKPIGKKLHLIDVAKLKKLQTTKPFRYRFGICRSYSDLIEAAEYLQEAAVLVIDIETNFHNQITSISFTPILKDWSLGMTSVISLMPSHYPQPDDVIMAWTVVKELCENHAPKAFHNGTFDCFHLLRFNICVENYLWDTEYIWRCWHAELPKALAKVCSYILPDFYYWKHEAETSPLEYNGKDTINTARILSYMLQYAPNWVWTNYAQMVPNIGPVLYTSFEGILTDPEKLAPAKEEAQADLDQDLQELRAAIGLPDFNPGSPQQCEALLYGVLRAKKPKRAKSKSATGKIELHAVARQHPLFAFIAAKILSYRENRKAISTYYDAKLTSNNRLLYSYNLDGTETARMSCNASSLRTLKSNRTTYVKSNMDNLGTQLQNVPYYHKKALRADPGFRLGNIDKAQSEARCVGYISPCPALIEALENPPLIAGVRDFYCYTGYGFFGVEFNKESDLRQAVKKIIHGTNYVMGIQTFIESAGDKGLNEGKIIDGITNLQKYKQILGYRGSIYNFAKHLLSLYHDLYPEVSEAWDDVKLEVSRTGRVVTPDGWVRLVEGDITKHHSILRGIVAHKSQHWSVYGINQAFWKLFYELQVPSKGEYRLKGQIHDSILYQAKEDKFDYYEQRTLEIMDIPQPCDHGIMRIPLDTESGIYWKE